MPVKGVYKMRRTCSALLWLEKGRNVRHGEFGDLVLDDPIDFQDVFTLSRCRHTLHASLYVRQAFHAFLCRDPKSWVEAWSLE